MAAGIVIVLVIATRKLAFSLLVGYMFLVLADTVLIRTSGSLRYGRSEAERGRRLLPEERHRVHRLLRFLGEIVINDSVVHADQDVLPGIGLGVLL